MQYRKYSESLIREQDEQWGWVEAHDAQEDHWIFTEQVPEVMKKSLFEAEKEFEVLEKEFEHSEMKWYGGVRDTILPNKKYFWRIKNPEHPDVIRAKKLLERIGGDAKNNIKEKSQASRWLAELKRNNTVLTADVLGAYRLKEDAPLVLDVRGAKKVSLKLYRVKSPKTLLSVMTRLGRDFMFRDYGLTVVESRELREPREARAPICESIRIAERPKRRKSLSPVTPQLKKEDLVHEWNVDLKKLKKVYIDTYAWEDWYDEDTWENSCDGENNQEAQHFDDRCENYRKRIGKSYRKEEGEISSWFCDRVLSVPGKYLDQAGAYILVIEANEQSAYIPLMVDPLSLTLRRCRDGVFALLSDTEGLQGIDDAFI